MNIESIQIHLNSKFATSYNNNLTSDANFFLPLIELPSQHTIYISVVHAIIPYSFYSVNSTNNTIYYQQYSLADGVNSSFITMITLEAGNYNAYQFANYLSSALPTTTVTYNVITNKFTFTNAIYDFVFLVTTAQMTTAYELLGLSIGKNNLSISNTYTSYNPINLSSKGCICIASNLTTGNLNNSNKSDINILCSVPITTQPNGSIIYTNDSNLRSNLFTNTIGMINIKLVDQLGRPIDLNDLHFSLTLQLDVVDFVN
jgi:hypothetical protein